MCLSVATGIAAPDLLTIFRESRSYHQPFWLPRASGRLALLPEGMIVEPSSHILAWLLIALPANSGLGVPAIHEVIQDGFLHQATTLIVHIRVQFR